MRTVYICSDTVRGILSAVYDAWPVAKSGKDCMIMPGESEEQMLFCEYRNVEETDRKARAVERMIRKNLGASVYRDLYYAMLSPEPDKAEAVLGTMLAARKIADSRRIMDDLSHPKVARVFELSRSVGREVHSFQGFVRFRMLKIGVLYAPITPKAQVLTCLAPYFQDRMPMENWMIHDVAHRMFAVHEAGKHWVLTKEESEEGWRDNRDGLLDISEDEVRYAQLWSNFFHSISIESRENPGCQQQHLPLRYRPDMTEFCKEQNGGVAGTLPGRLRLC